MRKTSLRRAAGALGATSAFLALLGLPGCASGSSTASPIVAEATDLPDHFMVVETGFAKRGEPRPGGGCRSPMVDPRDGTSLVLLRSKDGTGDYQLLNKDYELKTQYGVDSRHLLRLDCGTGKALGIVDR